jgi:DNA-binding transcriptional MerR regulator
MKKVHEVCKSIGVSRRLLHYYDEIGLLSPTVKTESGYRLYDDMAVKKLWEILLMKELGYPLNDIKKIMDDSNFDLRESLGEHIEILNKKKKRLENLIGYASIIKITGVIPFNFEEYGDVTFEEFIENSKKTWNINMFTDDEAEGVNNPLDYKLFQKVEEYIKQPEKAWSEDEIYEATENILSVIDIDTILTFTELIDEFRNFIDKGVNSNEVQAHVKKLYDYINNSFDSSMSLNGFSLWGQMFKSGGDIGKMYSISHGEETVDYIAKAIQNYCDKFTAEQR